MDLKNTESFHFKTGDSAAIRPDYIAASQGLLQSTGTFLCNSTSPTVQVKQDVKLTSTSIPAFHNI